MRPFLTTTLLTIAFSLAAAPASAQYNRSAGTSAPRTAKKSVEQITESGERVMREVDVVVQQDTFGNAAGADYDLAVDGAFEGQGIVVLPFDRFDFSAPKAALEKKGFSVYRFSGLPTPARLKEVLSTANQFWLISNCSSQATITDAHVTVIREFFNAGHGVYLWGDNDPCFEDANFVARRIFDVEMRGDTRGDQTITLKTKGKKSGVLEDHLLSTGIEYIYEGVTIATIDSHPNLKPFVWGSAGNVVASLYDRKGKRAIIDGGFTRLYYKWNTAGTGRYVTNAAAWLANYERFGDSVVADRFKGTTR